MSRPDFTPMASNITKNPGILIAIALIFLGTTATAQLGDLVVSASEQIEINGTRVLGVVRVESAGEIRVKRYAASGIQRSRLEIIANRIEIQDTARIDGTESEGEPYLPALPEDTGGYGGSYGGRGGAPTPELQQPTHGNADQPNVMRGSFGGDGPMHTRLGGLTGGAVTLRADTVVVDGEITCDGMKGEDWSSYPGSEPYRYFGAGGGSGGGILILAKNLTIGPNARITANGGDGGEGFGGCYHGFPGGGGRIKIFYEQGLLSESALIEVRRGQSLNSEFCGGDGGAEDGTVHIQQVPSIAQLLNPGDVNEDGVTDHEDLFLFMQSWQQELTPIPSPQETPTPTATPAP